MTHLPSTNSKSSVGELKTKVIPSKQLTAECKTEYT